jgi:hypothetical protein
MPGPASRRFYLEANTRDRHQEVLKFLGRLRADEITIGDDHGRVLAVPGNDLRSVTKGAIDYLAKARLGVLKLPRVHFSRIADLPRRSLVPLWSAKQALPSRAGTFSPVVGPSGFAVAGCDMPGRRVLYCGTHTIIRFLNFTR